METRGLSLRNPFRSLTLCCRVALAASPTWRNAMMPTTSSVPQPVSLLVILDSESLLARYPEPSQSANNPTIVDSQLIYGLCARAPKLIAQNKGNLQLNMTSGETLHLRGQTLALRAEQSLLFYAVSSSTGGVLSMAKLVLHDNLSRPSQNPNDLLQPISQNASDYYWELQVQGSGVEHCQLDFMLVDQSCSVLGYFRWDCEVEICESC